MRQLGSTDQVTRRRGSTAVGLALAVLLLGLPPGGAAAQTLKVMVTNDDGIAAPGIDALVNQLALNANLDIVVIAPANNSSGTGENRTSGPIGVYAGSTASGFPATVVNGFPGDTALYGILQELQSDPPDLVVSGINQGQNLSAEIIPLSGTVGAATWAARLGVPAIAVSAGLGSPPNFVQAATYTADVVEVFRVKKGFRKKMIENGPTTRGLVLNINVPTCTTGSVRGARVVAVGRASQFTGYSFVSSMSGVDTWQPTIVNGSAFVTNCTSTFEDPLTDLEAFNNGFVSISVLNPERDVVGRKLKQFKFLERLF